MEVVFLNRNVTIVVIILVLVTIAGYLVWLRSRYQPPVSPQTEVEETVTPAPMVEESASPSATPASEEATKSTKQKSPTPSPKASSKAATGSGVTR